MTNPFLLEHFATRSGEFRIGKYQGTARFVPKQIPWCRLLRLKTEG
ncbi:uncharacterized protein Dmul_36020 [Desulfococcus multivorans]|nr:uncharacterized protein Dmul_36020 [Desulfococcus multivorans]